MSEIFGFRLKKLRNEHGLKQKELAAILDVSLPTISAWEVNRQEPPIKKLTQIASYFNVTTDYLTGHDKKTLLLIEEEKTQLILDAIEKTPSIKGMKGYQTWKEAQIFSKHKYDAEINNIYSDFYDEYMRSKKGLKKLIHDLIAFEKSLNIVIDESKYYDVECEEQENLQDSIKKAIRESKKTN